MTEMYSTNTEKAQLFSKNAKPQPKESNQVPNCQIGRCNCTTQIQNILPFLDSKEATKNYSTQIKLIMAQGVCLEHGPTPKMRKF